MISPERKLQVMKDTIETLHISQEEDRMSLFTVLSILVAYTNGDLMLDQEVDKQIRVINDIFNRYSIDTMQDLNSRINDCGIRMRNRNLLRLPSLGGIH